MAPISSKYINDFGLQAIEQFSKTGRKIASLSEKYPGRIASSIYVECSVHLLALAKTTADLVKELEAWAVTHQESNREPSKVTQASWDFAIQSLKNCVQIARFDQTKQLIELASVIAEKAASLAGFEAVKLVFDVVNAARDSRKVWGILDADRVTAGRALLELELFTMSALGLSQLAVAQVHAITQPKNLANVSIKETAPGVMQEAREFVVERVRRTRQEFSESGAKRWIRFPEEGLWADAPALGH